jgi:hypothetical protein
VADCAADHAEDACDGLEEDEAREPALGSHFEHYGLFFAVGKLRGMLAMDWDNGLERGGAKSVSGRYLFWVTVAGSKVVGGTKHTHCGKGDPVGPVFALSMGDFLVTC